MLHNRDVGNIGPRNHRNVATLRNLASETACESGVVFTVNISSDFTCDILGLAGGMVICITLSDMFGHVLHSHLLKA